MATQRAMRRFPLNLNIGNDICHVVRIRGILESARATRFIQKILNPDERRHPKIQWALKNEAFTDSSKREFSSTAFDAAVKTPTLIQPEDLGPSRSGLHSYQLQIAATFMAGRYALLLETSKRTLPNSHAQVCGQRGCHQSPSAQSPYLARYHHHKPSLCASRPQGRTSGHHQGRKRGPRSSG